MRTNLFIPSHFWTSDMNFDTCCQRYISTCRRNFRCTSTFSRLNYCSGIFFKSLSYLYEVVRTNFSANFFELSQFLTAISQNLWRHLPTKLRTRTYVVHQKPRPNRPINGNAMLVRTVHPSNEQRAGLGA